MAVLQRRPRRRPGGRSAASHLEECELGDGVRVGSYCRVRPNTVLASGVELGTHAEVKNSIVGAGTASATSPACSTATWARRVNIGAGTVTCNYDGEREAPHRRSATGSSSARNSPWSHRSASGRLLRRRGILRRPGRARRRARCRPEPAAQHRGMGGSRGRCSRDRLQPVRRAAAPLGQRQPRAQRADRP